MDRLITTTFFMLARENMEHSAQSLKSEYYCFAEALYALCQQPLDPVQRFFILTYTLIEFKAVDHRSSYLDKAIELLEAALKRHRQYAQPHRPAPEIPPKSPFVWTGKSVHLVELAYALAELRSVNDGAVGIAELIDYLSRMFGIEIKDCFGAYCDIKHRKGDSRTYFLDALSQRLNERIERDEQKEEGRR